MKKTYGRCGIVIFIICGFWIINYVNSYSAITDTYIEDFDDREADATIDGIDSWNVDQGGASGAITQGRVTCYGSGNALELTGKNPSVNVSRSKDYNRVSPCWIEFLVKPGVGAQERGVPAGKIAAISFDYTGKIYAADGSSWIDIGKTFSLDTWYRVILKLDFSTRLYDIYIRPVADEPADFTADKKDLNFIDSKISSLTAVGFGGAYNISRIDDSYVEDVVIHFIDKLEIITAAQILTIDEASLPIIAQLQNSYSSAQTAWRDITLELLSSSDKGRFSLDKNDWQDVSEVTVTEGAQSVTFYYKDSEAGNPIITVREYPERGWTEARQQQKIVSEMASFDVAVTTPHLAGEYFDVEVTAKDDHGEVNEFYSGKIEILPKYISPGTGAAVISPVNAFGFYKGKVNLQLIYPDCGIIQLMVRDTQDASKLGYSGDILFIPAGFTVFSQIGAAVNAIFQLTASAVNVNGEGCPNYQGPANVFADYVSPPSVAGGAITPSTITEGQFSAGYAQISAKYNRWGTIRIKVVDGSYPDRGGVSDSVNFLPTNVIVEVETPKSGRDFFYTAETFEVAVSVVDADGEPIPNYQGIVDISSTLGLDITGQYQFKEDDLGRKVFPVTVDSPGTYEVSVVDEISNLSGKSSAIKVKRVTVEVVSVFAPVGTAEVVIRLMDEEGNVISSEDELDMQVTLEEEYADGSASSSAVEEPVTFKKGVAKIGVSNLQAEIVTISPKARYDFKVKKGTITFGRVAKTGIGSLMWREIKE